MKIYCDNMDKTLNSFFFNGNGTIEDILVFAKDSAIYFESKEKALDWIEKSIDIVDKQTHYIPGLKEKLIQRLEELKFNIFE